MKIVQTMKYEIEFDKEVYKILDEIGYIIWKVRTKSATMAFDWQRFSFGYNERFGKYPKEKEVIGAKHKADVYHETKKLALFVNRTIVDVATQEVCDEIGDKSGDISKGNESLPTYRRNGSFPMRAQSINKLTKINKNRYTVRISLLSNEGAKERGTKTQRTVTLKTGKGAYEILDRILDGTYKMCDSKIKKYKSKYYLLLAYQFEKPNLTTLDENKIMGIDVGVTNPVYMAFNFSVKRACIDGEELTSFRKKVQARRNSMLKQGKYCGKGRRGRGTATRLKPIEKLQNKVEDFKKNMNHKYAKYVVETAVKNNCGVIQMEDLKDISTGDKKATFLGGWTYYDLQSKIEHKAKKAGIEVVKVKPAHTSARCSKCGFIHSKDTKNTWRPSQDKFICQTCGFKTHADYNAAKNISMKGIEKEIEQQLKAQEDYKKHAMKYIV